jgi:hypothetical protein
MTSNTVVTQKHGLGMAIQALELAAECGGELDQPFYREALAEMRALSSRIQQRYAFLEQGRDATLYDYSDLVLALGVHSDPSPAPATQIASGIRRYYLASKTKAGTLAGFDEEIVVFDGDIEFTIGWNTTVQAPQVRIYSDAWKAFAKMNDVMAALALSARGTTPAPAAVIALLAAHGFEECDIDATGWSSGQHDQQTASR